MAYQGDGRGEGRKGQVGEGKRVMEKSGRGEKAPSKGVGERGGGGWERRQGGGWGGENIGSMERNGRNEGEREEKGFSLILDVASWGKGGLS